MSKIEKIADRINKMLDAGIMDSNVVELVHSWYMATLAVSKAKEMVDDAIFRASVGLRATSYQHDSDTLTSCLEEADKAETALLEHLEKLEF